MKKRQSVVILVLAGILALGGMVWASGAEEAAEEGPVELDFVNWATAEEQTRIIVEDLIEKFEAENPGITVNSIPSGFSDILNQLTVMYNAGDAPDIAQAAGVNVSVLHMMGALAPAEDLFPAQLRNDFFEPMYDLMEFEGQHWGVPWGGASFGFLYNRDLMEQAGLDPDNPPTTFDEFKQAVRTARENLPDEVVIMGVDTTLRVFGFEHNYPFIRGADAEPFDTDPPQFDTPEVREYLSWLREAARNNYTLPNKKLGEFRPLAAQGRLLFMFDQQHIKGTVRALNPDISSEDFNDTWGLAKMPADADGNHYTSSGDHQLVVFSDSPHKEEAARFVEFLIDSDYALENHIKFMGMTPATRGGVERVPAFREDPILNGFIEEIIPIVVPMPYGPNYSDYAVAFMAGVQEAMTSNKSIENIAQTMQQQVESIR